MILHATVVAKAPVAGRVKTRLSPPCTPEQAAAVAAAGLADTLDAVAALTVDRAIAVRRTLLLDGAVQPWMPATFDVVAQRGDGLAARLRNGFADLGPGVVVGMETPHVAPMLGHALELVADGDDVLGLAEDGGYWMIGLSARTVDRVDDVFSGVPMSTSRTGAVQLRRLRRAGGHVHLLPSARDLDDWDDLVAVAASGRAGRLPTVARTLVDRLATPA